MSYGLPMEKMVHDAYARGRFPVWSSDLSGGRPLFPNPNAGPLHPVRPLLSVLPFPLAMRLFPVLHRFLAGAGMLLLVGSLGVSRAAALLSLTLLRASAADRRGAIGSPGRARKEKP